MEFLPYNPGRLPVAPSPSVGEIVEFTVEGWPPCKDISASIRNQTHKQHELFRALRQAASSAMKGHAWYMGPIGLHIRIHCPEDEPRRPLGDYTGGIMDTLGGCHGFTFTYLPIIYEDDAQVSSSRTEFVWNSVVRYELRIEFLDYLAQA